MTVHVSPTRHHRQATDVSRRHFLGGLAAVGVGLAGADALLQLVHPDDAAAASLRTVTVQAGWINEVEWAGFYYAQARGYMRANGLTQVWMPGGATIDPRAVVAAGRAQIGSTGGANYILGFRAQGAPVVAIGALYQKGPAGLVSLASKPIHTPKDMIGKKIGVSPVSTQFFNQLLQANNIASGQVTVVNVGSDTSVLTSGQVDAIIGYATQQPLFLANRGYKTAFMYAQDFGGYPYGDIFFTTEDVLAAHEDALVAWMKACTAGWQAVFKDPAAGVDVTMPIAAPGLTRADQSGELKAQIPLMQSALTRRAGLFTMDPALWQRTMETMLRFKQLKAPLDVSKAFTTRIVERAAR